MKIAYISSHPAPYRDSFLGLLVNKREFKTKVFSLSPRDKGHDFWKLESPPYENICIFSSEMSWLEKFLKLVRNIVFGGYDCVCWPGFMHTNVVVCMIIQVLLRKKYVIIADTVQQRKINKLFFWGKKFLVQKAAFIFVPGKKSCDFFINVFGVDRSRVCLGAYSLDGQQIESTIQDLRKKRNGLRSRYGIGINDKVFLMVANMIKSRCYPLTSSAFLAATQGRTDVKFVMVGRGEELSTMQGLSLKKSSLLVLPGVSFSEMLDLYALSDVYVHGGEEPASTALIIGAIAQLPLISSYSVGCSEDVLIDGKSGFAVNDYLSRQEWIDVFHRAIRNEYDWCRLGVCARILSKELDCEKVIAQFCKKILTLNVN